MNQWSMVPAREWKPDVASVEFLVTEERADKLSGA
jgi:hypothetical protein